MYMTIDECAALLRISRWTVSRMVKDGELTAVKAKGRNGAVRIETASVDDYLARHTVQATASTRS